MGSLTRGQARAIEQAMTVRAGGVAKLGGRYENLINSISPSHPWYDAAVDWGEQWLKTAGY